MLSIPSVVALSLAICSPAVASVLQPRQGTATNCPAAPTGDVVWSVTNMVVTNKNGKAHDISFDITKSASGVKSLTCTPDTGIVTGFKGGKRFECDGVGNGKYKFAYFGGTDDALWLKYAPLLGSNKQGTAPLSLQCDTTDTTCQSVCPIYVAMLEETPDN